MKLNGLQIGTENSNKLAEFYTKVLGDPVWHMDDWYGWVCDGANIMIGPHSAVKGVSLNPERIMMQFECVDVSAEFERIKQCGAAVIAEPYQPDADKSPDVWLATLADTDGNYLQLATPWEG